MKYAKEILDVMASYPDRDWRMIELVNSVAGKDASQPERRAATMGIRRVLEALKKSRSILVRKPNKNNGHFYLYRLRVSK